MIRVIKYREPDYQIECSCGAVLQFNETDIETWTHHDWEFSVTYHRIICPECKCTIPLQQPFTRYRVKKEEESE